MKHNFMFFRECLLSTTKLKMIFILLATLSSAVALAQVKQITGKVVDDNNKPLPAATIKVKGLSKVVQTDSLGRFTVKLTEEKKSATLVVTYVNFLDKEVVVTSNEAGTIKLTVDSKDAGDDVVVMGYYQVKRKDLTASVTSVGAKELKDIPINSAADALAGRLAGVQIISSEGSPDADVRVRVRGGGSITQDNSPLYIVDGVQIENALSVLSPQDIQTVDVLKDASATAIYGARGANGVVVITTKSAKAGKPKVALNSFIGTKQLPKELSVLSPYEYVVWEWERSRGTDDTTTFKNRYGSTFDTLNVYKQMPFTDWQKMVMGNPGFMQTHNVSVGGGKGKFLYNLSYTYNQDKTTVRNSKFDRNLVNIKLDYKPSKKVKFSINTRYNYQDVFGFSTSDDRGTAYNRLRNTVKYQPFLLPGQSADQLDPDAVNVGNGLSLINPIKLADGEYRKRVTETKNISGSFTYNFTNTLVFKSTIGVDFQDFTERIFNDTITADAKRNNGGKPIAELNTRTQRTINFNNTLTYSIRGYKNKHDFDFLVGQEVYELSTDRNFKRYLGLKTGVKREDVFGILNDTALQTGYPIIGSAKFTQLSFFGRIGYTYDKRFIFSFNLRADGSSKFSENNRWGYFPSASIAWRISQENFFSPLQKIIKDFKLRASYGTTGNSRIDDYLWATTFGTNTNLVSGGIPILYGLGGQPSTGLGGLGLANYNLKWETTINRNLGLDLSFMLFKKRFDLTVDYYENSGRDLLLNVQIPSSSGYSTQIQNIAQTRNTGLEFQLNSNLIQKKKFSYSINFNLAFNQNKIEYLSRGINSDYYLNSTNWGPNIPADYIVKIGEAVGTMYGLVTDGFYTPEDFTAYNPTTNTYTLKDGVVNGIRITGSPRPGTIKFKKQTGSDTIDVTKDRAIIGNANPLFIGGLNQQFTFKNFDLSIFVNWVVGNNVYNANKIELTNAYTPFSNILSVMKDRFRRIDADGNVVTDLNQLAAINKNAKIWTPSSSTGAFIPSSWAIEDGSFLRINNISLGYTLPTKFVKKLHLTKVRIYTTVNNVALFTSYSGFDPDVSVKRDNTLAGLDYSAFPRSRSYLFGLNVNF